MKKNNSKTLLLVTLAAAAIGILLQLWLQKTGIDGHGLVTPGHPAGVGLMILTGVEMLLLFLHLQVLPKEVRAPQQPKFSNIHAMGYLVTAAGLVYTGMTMLSDPPADMLNTLLAVFSLITAATMGYMAYCKLGGHSYSYLLYGVVTIFMMIFLACQYQQWSSETQLLRYFFPLLATVFLMLGCYYRASLTARGKRPRELEFVTLGALFFCCLSVQGDYWVLYLTMAIWMATDPCLLHTQPGRFQRDESEDMALPHSVAACLHMLQDAGFDAYVVGGCVRDALLGLEPQDYDMCTNASPQEIRQVFENYELVLNGEKHGTVGVVINDAVYEITTFRTEGGYEDSRHPDWVEFVSEVEADLARRDFTVNAIAYCPETGYVDPWKGQRDLQDKALRAVGDPETRFTEDPLRILRGVRFAVRYGLQPEAATEAAMAQLAPEMEKLAKERVFSELCKLLPLVSAEDLLRFQPVLTRAIPELAPTVDFDQKNPHHTHDLYTHTAQVTAAAPAKLALRWAALLHDIGKPDTFTVDENGVGHFLGHAQVSAQMADEILRRLKSPTRLREQVVCLIQQHMTPLEADKHLLHRRLSKLGEEVLRDLLELQKADLGSKSADAAKDTQYQQILALLEELLQEQACLSVKDLAVNGNDLIQIGFAPDPQLGQCLDRLLELVQDETVPNEKEPLLQKAKEFLEQ